MQLDVKEIPLPATQAPHAARVVHGRLIPPQQQILLYSAEEWEGFTYEWVHSKRTDYNKVVRFSGAGDLGIDVAAFCDPAGFAGT
jgi:hypothetical protein